MGRAARKRGARGLERRRALWQTRGRAAGARWARGRGAARALGVRLGRAAGQRAVHLVHSAYFWPGLTQYYS